MRNSTKWLSVALLLASGAVSQIGCRACGTCHDYDAPVADCECLGACGTPGSRRGSAVGHYADNSDAQEMPSIAVKPTVVK